jgi:beta-glucosidase
MIGSEARDSGFNVMLAGGINLAREPRNGRNFEYAGEDPLLAAKIVAAEINGIQSNNIIATIKHFAANDQETGRFGGSANLAEDQARMSDLLAFELAIEESDPGSVMCAYNRFNAVYACENDFLLNKVLKKDWGYKGWVMSDWGAVHSTANAMNAGLDQQSGWIFDTEPFFAPDRMKMALAEGSITQSRIDDAVRRQLRSMFAKGVIDHPVRVKPINFAAHAKVTQADAEESLVLLKNEQSLLPLGRNAKSVLIIGGHADKGVMAGGGSSTVFPVGGNAVPELGPQTWPGPIVFHPSAPFAAIQKRLPLARLAYDDGSDPERAAKLAADADLVILFATQWATEDRDVSLTLVDGQDALIAKVAKANKQMVLVIESGGPVLMPWIDQVPAVLEAWFPGTSGGEAIARVLFGEVDASGRLPVTFPQSLDQLPRPTLDGVGKQRFEAFDINYEEGAAIGYKWFDRQDLKPLFPFGFGLSYSRFAFSKLAAKPSGLGLSVQFSVRNIGHRAGKAVAQIYASPTEGGWEAPKRLVGFQKLALERNREKSASLTIDPRLLATFDSTTHEWRIAAGNYRIMLNRSASETLDEVTVTLPEQHFSAGK